MRKKLLAGMLALALCSTNMPLQTIFAEEFTSGNPDVVSEEETPEIFTNEEQETAGETDEELSVFSSEEVPEFNDTPDEAMAAAENVGIDLANVSGGIYTISSAGNYTFTCKKSPETSNRIVVDGTNTSEQDNINIYLDNVNIKRPAGSALQINNNVKATVTIYLTGTNNLITSAQSSAGLQKANGAQLIIDNSSNTTGELIAQSKFGAGIGGYSSGSSSNITISGGTVTATSTRGAGIGGGQGETGSDITISGGSVNAQIDCTPHKNLDSSGKYDQNSSEVYLCTIPNANNEPILIDGNVWEPSNHTAVVPTNTNLYAWLTGENHTVKVGNNIIAYSFDNGTFTRTKANPDIKQFTFTPPSNLTYDGNPKEATISTKSGITDMGAITVKYFQGDAKLPGALKDAGTYIVKIDIDESQNYHAATNLSDLASWTFTINPASEAPGYTTQTTIPVSWSCKKVGDITNILPAQWIWKDTD